MPTFKSYMARILIENGHSKKDMYCDDIDKNTNTTLSSIL